MKDANTKPAAPIVQVGLVIRLGRFAVTVQLVMPAVAPEADTNTKEPGLAGLGAVVTVRTAPWTG